MEARLGRRRAHHERAGCLRDWLQRNSVASRLGHRTAALVHPTARHVAGRTVGLLDTAVPVLDRRTTTRESSAPAGVDMGEAPPARQMSSHDGLPLPWSPTPRTGGSGSPWAASRGLAWSLWRSAGRFAVRVPGSRLGTFLVPSAGRCGM